MDFKTRRAALIDRLANLLEKEDLRRYSPGIPKRGEKLELGQLPPNFKRAWNDITFLRETCESLLKGDLEPEVRSILEDLNLFLSVEMGSFRIQVESLNRVWGLTTGLLQEIHYKIGQKRKSFFGPLLRANLDRDSLRRLSGAWDEFSHSF